MLFFGGKFPEDSVGRVVLKHKSGGRQTHGCIITASDIQAAPAAGDRRFWKCDKELVGLSG